MTDATSTAPIYLKKSVRFYKVYGGLFLFSILMTAVKRPLDQSYSDILDLAIALPILVVMVLAPIGLAYSIKSIKRKEGSPTTRLLYFSGHSFFCLVILLLIIAVIKDISQLFTQ